jgi:hypothetical protein
MPVNRNKIDPASADNSLTKRGEEDQSNRHAYLGQPAKFDEEKLRRTLTSLSGKIGEFEEINRKLFQSIDDVAIEAPASELPGGTNLEYETSPQDTSSISRLEYQLNSLMEVLKPELSFNDWGVFLLRGINTGPMGTDKGFEEIVSSGHLENNQASKDFENEVSSQYTCGNVHHAISMKKRMHFPAERGDILVVPFFPSIGKEGFWAMHFESAASALSDSGKELLLWGAEIITSLLENTYKNDTKLSPQTIDNYWLEKEKLFSLSQLSRAMVHEVNNSMQIILGRAQIARINLNKKADITTPGNAWETIEKNANRINGILKNFSDFLHRHSIPPPTPVNKISKRVIAVTAKEVNLHRLLESNLDLLQYILGSSGIELELKNSDDLPLVYGEPEELELAIMGLLWGIRDNLTGGGNIRIRTFPENGFLSLNIDWSGKGNYQEKSPGENEPDNCARINQAMKIIERYDHNLRCKNMTGKEGWIMVKIPAIQNQSEVSRKEVES